MTQLLVGLGRLKGWPVSGFVLGYRKCFDPMPQGIVLEVYTRLGWDARVLAAPQQGTTRASHGMTPPTPPPTLRCVIGRGGGARESVEHRATRVPLVCTRAACKLRVGCCRLRNGVRLQRGMGSDNARESYRSLLPRLSQSWSYRATWGTSTMTTPCQGRRGCCLPRMPWSVCKPGCGLRRRLNSDNGTASGYRAGGSGSTTPGPRTRVPSTTSCKKTSPAPLWSSSLGRWDSHSADPGEGRHFGMV